MRGCCFFVILLKKKAFQVPYILCINFIKDKMEAIGIAHRTSMPSIISSGLSFFAATFGVGMIASVDMIASLCTLMARGAIISMFVVIFVLPSLFVLLDKVIIHTSLGFKPKKNSQN